MHPNKDLFVDYQELKAPISVDGIAGNRSAVGAGLVPIVDDRGNVACLENTLHVPGLPSGLFSLTRANKQILVRVHKMTGTCVENPGI
jgi:hypothetical protein